MTEGVGSGRREVSRQRLARHPRRTSREGRMTCNRCAAPVPPNAGYCKACSAPIGQ